MAEQHCSGERADASARNEELRDHGKRARTDNSSSCGVADIPHELAELSPENDMDMRCVPERIFRFDRMWKEVIAKSSGQTSADDDIVGSRRTFGGPAT